MRKRRVLLTLLVLLTLFLASCKQLPDSDDDVPGWLGVFSDTPQDDITTIPGILLIITCAVSIAVLVGLLRLAYALLQAGNNSEGPAAALAVLANGFSVFINAVVVLRVLRTTGSVGEAITTHFPGFLSVLQSLGVDLSINPVKIFADLSILGLTVNAPLIINGWRVVIVVLSMVFLWYGALALDYKGLVANISFQVGWIMNIVFYFVMIWFLGAITPSWDLGAKQAGVSFVYFLGFAAAFIAGNIIFPAVVFWKAPSLIESRSTRVYDGTLGRYFPRAEDSGNGSTSAGNGGGDQSPPPQPRDPDNGPDSSARAAGRAALVGALGGAILEEYLDPDSAGDGEVSEDDVEYFSGRSGRSVAEGVYEEISDEDGTTTQRNVSSSEAEVHEGSDVESQINVGQTVDRAVHQGDVDSSEGSSYTRTARRNVRTGEDDQASNQPSDTDQSTRNRAASVIEAIGGLAASSSDRNVSIAGRAAQQAARSIRQEDDRSTVSAPDKDRDQSSQRSRSPSHSRGADVGQGSGDEGVETFTERTEARPSERESVVQPSTSRSPAILDEPNRKQRTPTGDVEYVVTKPRSEQRQEEKSDSRELPQGPPKTSSSQVEPEYLAGRQAIQDPSDRDEDQEQPRRDVLPQNRPKREDGPPDVEYLS